MLNRNTGRVLWIMAYLMELITTLGAELMLLGWVGLIIACAPCLQSSCFCFPDLLCALCFLVIPDYEHYMTLPLPWANIKQISSFFLCLPLYIPITTSYFKVIWYLLGLTATILTSKLLTLTFSLLIMS